MDAVARTYTYTYTARGENVKRWTNVWGWCRCYPSKVSLHPPTLGAQSSSICLQRFLPPRSNPRLFRSVTSPPRDARENRINRCSLSFFPPFFPAFNPFYSQTETRMTPRASNSKSSCRPCKRFQTSEVLSSRILLLNDGLSIPSYVFSVWSTSRVLWRFLLYLHFSRFNLPKLFKRFPL